MRLLSRLLISLVSALLLTACPLESGVPLAGPTPGSLDSRLLGVWYPVEGEAGSLTVIEFMAFNDAEYYAEVREFRSDGLSKREQYRLYIVTIRDQKFLQIQRLGTEKYNLARYSIDESGLSLRFVGDKGVPPETNSNQAALRAFIEKNMAGTSLDDGEGPVKLTRSGA